MRVEVSRMELGESQPPCRVPPAALAPALRSSASRGAGRRVMLFTASRGPGAGLRHFTVKQGRRVTMDRRSYI